MTETPAYGVVSCGKAAPGPFADELGPCIHDPGHEGRCRYRSPLGKGGFVEVKEVTADFPEAEPLLEDMRRDRRKIRRSLHIAAICCAVTFLCMIFSVLRAFGVI
jgi:hypothetical protein